ncbi:pyrroline-5-carboxylate reductase family protein [Litorisediminicola beolgyonensis]|uniref:Pyrroline-5-carboxylate reductase n=1 Tax=Litorisediminicola beolgyonensis TaxID=1173614 RepID=A0ABW3ZL65_9RHOB
MALDSTTIGIVGGAGALGSAIATALLSAGHPQARLIVSARSGQAPALAGWPGVAVTADNAELAARAEVILLSVPPAAIPDLSLDASGKLVISVVAGLTLDRLARITRARATIRAMSSPAAARGLAFSPLVPGPSATDIDLALAEALFAPCGLTARLTDEAQIDLFTAMTGPVPGFVAFWAECLSGWAVARGIPEDVALAATRQLFLSAGTILSEDRSSPAQQVQAMIDYAGTTAAGMEVLRASGTARDVEAALDAATEKGRTIVPD